MRSRYAVPYLMIVEHDISVDIFARYGQRPKLLHEEHLVSKFGHFCILSSGPHNPICEMSDEVKEKVALWHTDHCN
jgi:hypothetical protein